MRVLLSSPARRGLPFYLVVVVASLGRVDAGWRTCSTLALPRSAPNSCHQHRASTRVDRSVSNDTTIKKTAATTRALLTIRGGVLSSTTTETATSLGAMMAKIGDSVSRSKPKCWIVLLLSVLTEAAACTLAKHARDTASVHKFLVACGLYLICVSGFTLSLAQIEVGIAYACWAALGTAIVSSAGILLFGESCDPGKLMCLTLIMTGVMGLNLLDSH